MKRNNDRWILTIPATSPSIRTPKAIIPPPHAFAATNQDKLAQKQEHSYVTDFAKCLNGIANTGLFDLAFPCT